MFSIRYYGYFNLIQRKSSQLRSTVCTILSRVKTLDQTYGHHSPASNLLQLNALWFTTTASFVSITTQFSDTFLRALGKLLPLELKEYWTFFIRLGKSKTLLKSTLQEVPFPCIDIFATVAVNFIPLAMFLSTITWSTISTPFTTPFLDFGAILASPRKKLLEIWSWTGSSATILIHVRIQNPCLPETG